MITTVSVGWGILRRDIRCDTLITTQSPAAGVEGYTTCNETLCGQLRLFNLGITII